jgi:anthranilate phosphoribosyltransferase
MLDSLSQFLPRVAAGENLAFDEMSAVMDQVMLGHVPSVALSAFLLALAKKEETAEEIAGAAAALRKHAVPFCTTCAHLVDTCGTGGDGSNTFNISTAAAIVAAAAGIAVAKHGNRSATSKSGSADVLELLGVKIDVPVEVVQSCLDELGICFCFARTFHPAMKHVAEVRSELGKQGVRTIFNLLGPLANPAGARLQLLGVGRPELRGKLAAAVARLDTQHALLVSGDDGLDEITLAATTSVTEIVGQGGTNELRWSPAEFGLQTRSLETCRIHSPAESAAIIQNVLAGEPGPARDVVVLNAAAAIFLASKEKSLLGCAEIATAAIDSGAAAQTLARWAKRTQQT